MEGAGLDWTAGSEAFVPPVEGLDSVTVWTNREATTFMEVPRRVVMIGGSAVGVELGLFLRRYGAQVTIRERSDRLLPREDPRPGELTEQYLREEGIDVRTHTSAVRACKDGDDTVVELDSGDQVHCDVIIVGTGRTPRTADLGLENSGVQLGDRGEVIVDDHCRAADGVWALGDVTGVMPFTHVAMYMARVIADNIAGPDRIARYEGSQRVVFSDPEVNPPESLVGAASMRAQGRSTAYAVGLWSVAAVLLTGAVLLGPGPCPLSRTRPSHCRWRSPRVR